MPARAEAKNRPDKITEEVQELYKAAQKIQQLMDQLPLIAAKYGAYEGLLNAKNKTEGMILRLMQEHGVEEIPRQNTPSSLSQFLTSVIRKLTAR